MIARQARARPSPWGGLPRLVTAALPEDALAGVPGAGDLALANQDAFDAAVSAIALSRSGKAALEAPAGGAPSCEGWIWGARRAPRLGTGRLVSPRRGPYVARRDQGGEEWDV